MSTGNTISIFPRMSGLPHLNLCQALIYVTPGTSFFFLACDNRMRRRRRQDVTSGEVRVTIKIWPKTSLTKTGNCAWYSQAPRLSDRLGGCKNKPRENTTHVIWRIGRWLLSPQSPRVYSINFHDLCTLLSGSLEQDIPKLALTPTLE